MATQVQPAKLLQLSAEPQYLREDVDEHGDFVFRFEIDRRDDELTLREFFRAHIHELLSIVRFNFDGKPVLVDSFSFLNAPDEVIAILPDDRDGDD